MLIDRFEQIIPKRIQQSPLAKAVFAAFFSIVDALTDLARDAVAVAQPGQVEGAGPDLGGFPDVDALPMIGKDRGIVPGTVESFANLASRLRNWRAIRARAGLNWGLLEQVQAITGPAYLYLVSDHGYWWNLTDDGYRHYYTPTADGAYTRSPEGVNAKINLPAHPWDWDGEDPCGDTWLIVDCAVPLPGVVFGGGAVYGTSGPGTVQWGSGAQWGMDLGMNGAEFLDRLRQTIRNNAAMGVRVRYVIFKFDVMSFDPTEPGPYPAAGMPDGTWGKSYKIVGGVMVPTRLGTARYWDPGV